MSDQNTDIYYKLGAIHGDIKRVDEKTDNILTQTTKTNGRVTTLETKTIPELEDKLNMKIDRIDRQIAKYTGIASVIIFILSFILPKLLDRYI